MRLIAKVIRISHAKFDCNGLTRLHKSHFLRHSVCYLPTTKVFVWLCARLLKKVCVDLDEMLCVDRCRDMYELISFSAQSGLVQCPNRIAFSDIVCAATWNFTMSGKSHLQRRVVLHSFCSSRTTLSEVSAFCRAHF